MFAIVEFESNNSVAVVPLSWLAKDRRSTMWPPYKSQRIDAAVKKLEQPGLNWSSFQVKLMKTYG
jgi:hypothetical protein